MTRFFVKAGRFLIISRRNRRVRNSAIFLFKNFFVLGAAIVMAEVLLIYLGVNGTYLPLPHRLMSAVARLIF
jgi:hypothetical protein